MCVLFITQTNFLQEPNLITLVNSFFLPNVKLYTSTISSPLVSFVGLTTRKCFSSGKIRNILSTISDDSSYFIGSSDRKSGFERNDYRVIDGESVSHASTTFPICSMDFISDVEGLTNMSGMKRNYPLSILFLSADTGGGHRASAESLANQFTVHFPRSTCELMDIWTRSKVYPYKNMICSYKYLCAHPRQWKVVYHISNIRPYVFLTYYHSKITCLSKIMNYIDEYDPDVVISVHPTMNYVPLIATREVAKSKGKYIPFFTVVTDYGSGHCTWFEKGVDKIYVASERLRSLAKRRGNIPDEKIVMNGLPIRRDFVIQSEKIGDRMSVLGKAYRQIIMQSLNINPSKKMVLIMGGGEGVGFLERYAESIYLAFIKDGIDATICIACGRNENLRKTVRKKKWEILSKIKSKKRKRLNFQKFFKGLYRNNSFHDHPINLEDDTYNLKSGNVDVIDIGFVTNIAEYMVAADVLLSKAGPGTIAEATAVGLPVMVTSFLPGQEAGNVNVVLDGGFGSFCDNPAVVANTVVSWLKDDSLLRSMSENSSQMGNPDAASIIVKEIGDITCQWLNKNKNFTSI